VPNDLAFVRRVLSVVDENGCDAWVFGGWAEELLGVSAAREHGDVDLLHPAQSFASVDAFLRRDHRVAEIAAKRFPHKRAFDLDGVMVELILVRRDNASRYTNVWGTSRHDWPDDVLDVRVSGMRVASPAAVDGFRAAWNALPHYGTWLAEAG
jgi:aminoglycoside-2''-adenylyltransferase